MMRSFNILFMVMFIWLSTNAQDDTLFRLHKAILGDFTDFTVDNLGNIFLFHESGQLKKLNSNGDSVAVYNEVRKMGRIYSIDVSNPLKVLLYYKDFGTVVVLDRLLSLRDIIDLRRQGLFQVKAFGQSYDNGYWAFDEQQGNLKRLNDAGIIIDQFTDFRQLFDSMPSPQFVVDQNKNLYLYDAAKGVYIFDYYGSFRRRIPLLGWKDFTVINNILYGRGEKNLYKYEPGSLNLQQYLIPPYMIDARKIKIAPGNLYVLRNNRLEIYSYQR